MSFKEAFCVSKSPKFGMCANGVTQFLAIEPITLSFDRTILSKSQLSETNGNTLKSREKLSLSKEKLVENARDCIEVKKLSFCDTVLYLGVSPTTLRRVCRTLKIGRYRDDVPEELRLNSRQVPYGWNSVLGVMEKNVGEWRNVELMAELRAQGKSFHFIVNELNLKQIKTKNNGKWFAKTVSQILKFNQKFLKIKNNGKKYE